MQFVRFLTQRVSNNKSQVINTKYSESFINAKLTQYKNNTFQFSTETLNLSSAHGGGISINVIEQLREPTGL